MDNVMICPTLRSAANFTVVAGTAVSNDGLTVVNGNLAISPSIALTGFNPMGVINGTVALGNNIALQAQTDITIAYNDLKSVPMTAQMSGVDLSGKTLGAGVYKFDAAAGINPAAGILTLKGSGIFIFQIGSTLTTSTNSQIQTIDGARAGCIFWQVGSSVTLGQNSLFVGNILAYASVGLASGITYNGSIYARTAAISFISDTVNSQTSCNVCQNIPDSLQSQVGRNLPETIPLIISIMILSFSF